MMKMVGMKERKGTEEKNKRAAKVLLLCCQSNELMESVVLRVEMEVRMEGGATTEEDGDSHGDDAEGNEYPFDAAHGGERLIAGCEDAADGLRDEEQSYILYPINQRICRAEVLLRDNLRYGRPHS